MFLCRGTPVHMCVFVDRIGPIIGYRTSEFRRCWVLRSETDQSLAGASRRARGRRRQGEWGGCRIRPMAGGLHVIREIESSRTFSDHGLGMLLSEESKIIAPLNLERATEGLPILEYNDRLAATGRGHALDMALHDYSSHDRRDGRKFYECVFGNGYPVSKCGENIAVGLATAEEAFECLISSPGHRANIIDSDFTQIGVGHAINQTSRFHHFWAQDFGAGLSKRQWSSGLDLDAAPSLMRLFASVAKEFLIDDTPGIVAPWRGGR